MKKAVLALALVLAVSMAFATIAPALAKPNEAVVIVKDTTTKKAVSGIWVYITLWTDQDHYSIKWGETNSKGQVVVDTTAPSFLEYFVSFDVSFNFPMQFDTVYELERAPLNKQGSARVTVFYP